LLITQHPPLSLSLYLSPSRHVRQNSAISRPARELLRYQRRIGDKSLSVSVRAAHKRTCGSHLPAGRWSSIYSLEWERLELGLVCVRVCVCVSLLNDVLKKTQWTGVSTRSSTRDALTTRPPQSSILVTQELYRPFPHIIPWPTSGKCTLLCEQAHDRPIETYTRLAQSHTHTRIQTAWQNNCLSLTHA
jgi:hypothetical protein